MAISRTSKYFELKYVVECKQPQQAFYDTIAAFDNEGAAMGYCGDCMSNHGDDWQYRVMKRNNKSVWTAIK